jgi:hypothetical protein
MSKWHSVELGDGIEAFEPTMNIQKAFWPMHIALGSPADMGVYSKYDRDRNMVTAHFTPSAASLARIFKATECKEPSSDGLKFIAGPGSCLDIWPVGKF